MAIAKYVGPDVDRLIDNPLDRKASPLDEWIDVSI